MLGSRFARLIGLLVVLRSGAGAVYSLTVDPLLTLAWTAEGDQAGAFFGVSVATAGDVNGDGYSDLIVGASRLDNGQENEGRATLYLGSATGLSTGPAWMVESDQADAYFGFSSTVNGPNFASPFGSRLTEVLIAGPSLATIAGSHDGATGDIAPLFIPYSTALLGVSWAAQYLVVGGGFGDLSQAVHGVIGCQ